MTLKPSTSHDAAVEFVNAYGALTAEFCNFAIQLVDDRTRRKLQRYKDTDGFALAVSVEMAPSFQIRLLASADGKPPFAVFTLYPVEASVN